MASHPSAIFRGRDAIVPTGDRRVYCPAWPTQIVEVVEVADERVRVATEVGMLVNGGTSAGPRSCGRWCVPRCGRVARPRRSGAARPRPGPLWRAGRRRERGVETSARRDSYGAARVTSRRTRSSSSSSGSSVRPTSPSPSISSSANCLFSVRAGTAVDLLRRPVRAGHALRGRAALRPLAVALDRREDDLPLERPTAVSRVAPPATSPS